MNKIKKVFICLGLSIISINGYANELNNNKYKTQIGEFNDKSGEELDMNHRFSLNQNSFDLKNDLFDIKINKDISFDNRYETLNFLEKNFAVGKTHVEKGKIVYKGIFGDITAKNQEDFKEKLKENKKKIKVKHENNAKVIVAENAKEYDNRIKEILNKHNVDTNKKVSAFIFKEDKKAKIITVANKKISIHHLD